MKFTSGWFLKMSRKPPAFQCYASNLIADKNYRLMSLSERGLWISMYLECWANQGVPSSPNELAKFLGFEHGEIELNLTKSVSSFFSVNGELMVSPELDDYREGLKKIRKKQSDGGKTSQENRKRKNARTFENEPQAPDTSQLEGSLTSPLDKIRLNQDSVDKSIEEWVDDYDKTPELDSYQKMSKGF